MDSLSNDNGRCVPVFGSVEIPNAVVTCLEDVDETIECCIDPWTKHRKTKECVLGCPFYPYGEEKFLGLFYTGFGLTCMGLFFCAFAFIPVFINLPKFPKGLFPGGLVLFFCWNHTLYLTVYAGPVENFCGDEDDFQVARAEYLESTFCHVQAIMFGGFSFGLAMLLLLAAGSFAFFCATVNFPESKRERYLNLFQIPCVVLVILSAIVGACLQFGFIHIDPAEFFSIGYGFGCVPSPGMENPIFATVVGFFGFIIFFQFLGYFFISRKSWRLLSSISNLNIFILIMDYAFIALILNNALFANRDAETFQGRVVEYASCVALHPREVDSGCEYETGKYYAWEVIIIVTFALLPTVAVCCLYSLPLLFKWWVALFSERRVLKLEDLSKSTPYSTSHVE